jgi:hypothetical protein
MGDSDYSDSESIVSTYSESMQTTDLFEYLDLGKDANAYKKDKFCTICNCKFGKIGIAHARKHYCKFCYRGVCANCSPQVTMHPTRREKLRVCNACCKKAAINKYTEEVQMDMQHIRNEQERMMKELNAETEKKENIMRMVELAEKRIDEEGKKQIFLIQEKRKVAEMDEDLKEKQENRDGLMVLIRMHKLQLDNKDKTIKGLVDEKQKLDEDLKAAKTETVQFRNMLGEKQDESVLIKKRIDEEKMKILQREKNRSDYDKIEKLQNLCEEACKENDLLKFDNEKSSKKISELIKENQELEKDPVKKTVESDSLVASPKKEFSTDEEEKLSDLSKKRRENQAIIENLKVQLSKKQPKHSDPLDIDLTPADKSRPCVRCSII